MRFAILGAGISGLTLAHRLRQHADVTVFEARERPGGNIRTEMIADCRVEWGPNGFLDNEPATLELVSELGLDDRLVRARDEAARRFIWRKGALRELPTKPRGFLFGDALPVLARLRAMLEPLTLPAPDHDESVRDFAVRHLGKGAADILVDSFVTGVFAGDPSKLSVRSAFPKLRKLEKEYRSLILGAKGRGFGPKGTLTSFDDGLQVLIDALAEEADDLRLGTPVTSLEDLRDDYDRVICTIPGPKSLDLLPADVAELVAKIPTAPVVVVAQVFDAAALPATEDAVPDIFGFLVPRGQQLRILGTLYDSSIFPGRAPGDKRLFRTLIGGRRDPDAIQLTDDELKTIVADELERVWGLYPEPAHVEVIRHELGISQYEVGHAKILEEIESRLPDWLQLAGSTYRGVAINACVQEGMSWPVPAA